MKKKPNKPGDQSQTDREITAMVIGIRYRQGQIIQKLQRWDSEAQEFALTVALVELIRDRTEPKTNSLKHT